MKNGISDLNLRVIFGIIPLIPILILLAITDSFYNDINNLKRDYNANITHLEMQRDGMIRAIIFNRYNLAKAQNEVLKNDLLKTIDEKYASRKEALEDIKDSSISPKMYNIYAEVIEDDYVSTKLYDITQADHLVFISNKFGMLMVNSNLNPHKPYNAFRSWDDIMNIKVNKKITDLAIKSILYGSEHIIFWESAHATIHGTYLEGIIDMHKDVFEEIINKDDESIFKCFSVLVPTYISIGDAEDDIIIVREIDMFNIIQPYLYQFHKFHHMIEEYKFDMSRLIFIKILSCIAVSIALFCSFFLALWSTLDRLKFKEKR